MGSYTCRVVATTTTTDEQGGADIQITIEEQNDCSDTTVEKSLTIQYLIENVAHENILPVTIGTCAYRVVQIIPNDQGGYLVIIGSAIVSYIYNQNL